MVVVDDTQIDIPHLEIGGKREDHQLYNRQQEDDTGQETVPPDLLELLLQ